MFFLAYLKNERTGALRVMLPDFNVYTVADAIAEVPDQLQDAIAEQYRGRIPKSSALEDLQEDERYRDGWWLWLNLDVDHVGRRRGPRVSKRITTH